MSHIFISYSRKDLAVAEKIINALTKDDLEPWIDWKSIPKGEAFESEIQQGIEKAEIFLFLVSPDSVQSDWCKKEIAHAVKNGKRILPIVLCETDPKIIHPEISKRNWIFCRDGQDDFNKAIEETRKTIHTDYEWLKYHTELQVKALKWEQRKDASRLLRGKELREAEKQLAEISSQEDPQPTRIQREYILASQRNEVRNRQQITISLGIGFAIVAMLAVVAWAQRSEAKSQQATAEAASTLASENAATAQAEKERAEKQAEIAFTNQLAAQSQALLNQYPQRSLLLAVESVNRSLELPGSHLHNAENALRQALENISGEPFEGISNNVISFTVSPDEKWLAGFFVSNPTSDGGGVVQLCKILNRESLKCQSLTETVYPVQKIIFSNNNRWLIAVSGRIGGSGDENAILIWDMDKIDETTAPMKFSGYLEAFRDIAITIDDHWLIAVGNWNSIIIKDLTLLNKKGQNDIVFSENRDNQPTTIVASPNGKRFVILGYSAETLYVWETAKIAADAKPREITYENYADSEYFAAFSPDGNQLVVASSRETFIPGYFLHLWKINAPQFENPVILSEGSETTITGLLFSPDGKWIVAGFDDGKILLWSNKSPYKNPITLDSHDDRITAMEMSSDGRWLITGSNDGVIIVWDMFSPKQEKISILRGHDSAISGIYLSHDNSYMITLDSKNFLRSWKFPTPQKFFDPIILLGHRHPVFSAEFSGNSHLLATSGGGGGSGEDFNTRIWDLASLNGVLSPKLLINQGWAADIVAFSGDGRWIVTQLETDPTRSYLWDLTESKAEQESVLWMPVGEWEEWEEWWDENYEPSRFFISPNGEWLIHIFQDTLQVWDLNNFRIESPIVFRGVIHGFREIVFSKGIQQVVVVNRLNAFVIDLGSNSSDQHTDVYEITHNLSSIKDLITSKDRKWLIGIDRDNQLAIWNLNNLSINNYPQIFSGPDNCRDFLELSRDANWLIYQSADDSIWAWDIRNAMAIYLLGIKTSNSSLQNEDIITELSPDGKWLAINLYHGTEFHLWNLASDNNLSNSHYVVRGSKGDIEEFSFSSDGKSLVTINSDAPKVWNLSSKNPLDNPSIIDVPEDVWRILTAKFSPDNHWLVLTGYGGYVGLWHLPSDLSLIACQIIGRNFTQAEWQQYFPGEEYRLTCPQWPAGE
jgi:WD40 repeat protein